MRIDLGTLSAQAGVGITSAQAAAIKSSLEAKTWCVALERYEVQCADGDNIDTTSIVIGYRNTAAGLASLLQISCVLGSNSYSACLPRNDGRQSPGDEITSGGQTLTYYYNINTTRDGRSFFLDHAICSIYGSLAVVGDTRMAVSFYDDSTAIRPFSLRVEGTGGRTWLGFPDAKIIVEQDLSCAPTWFQPNTYWQYQGTPAGSGIASDKFVFDGMEIAGYLGYRPSIRAGKAGVVHITADSVSQDCIFRIFRNATSVYSYGVPDCINAGDNPPAALSTTFSVSAGDVITLGDPTDYHNLVNLKIWWTAS